MPFERIVLLKGDITEIDCEVIVNSANTELWLGSGVAGAILAKGGKSIEDEAVKQGPVELGDAVITRGGKLRAGYVIHAAAMRPGQSSSQEFISRATKNSLRIAFEKQFKSLAFPAIGTGVGSVSYGHCARAMLTETILFLEVKEFPRYVYFVLFDDEALKAFRETLKNLKE